MAMKPSAFKPVRGKSVTIKLDAPKAPKPMPKMPKMASPTAADRAASRRQDASLARAKVSAAEGRVIASANRSEGASKKPQIIRTTVRERMTPAKKAK